MREFPSSSDRVAQTLAAMEFDVNPTRRRRGRPRKTALDRFETSLFFSTLKSVSGKTWRELEDDYRRAAGLPKHDPTDSVDDFMDYAGGKRAPQIANDGRSLVDWALRNFPEVRSAQDTIIFTLLRSRCRGPGQADEARQQENSTEDFLRMVARVVLDATPAYGSGRVVRLPEHRLRRDLEAMVNVDHLDALAVLLIGIMESRSSGETVDRAVLCRQWLRRWTLSRPECLRSYKHLWNALHREMPQLGPLTGKDGLGAQMDAAQEHQFVLRCLSA